MANPYGAELSLISPDDFRAFRAWNLDPLARRYCAQSSIVVGKENRPNLTTATLMCKSRRSQLCYQGNGLSYLLKFMHADIWNGTFPIHSEDIHPQRGRGRAIFKRAGSAAGVKAYISVTDTTRLHFLRLVRILPRTGHEDTP